MAVLDTLRKIIPPRIRATEKGTARTTTFDANAALRGDTLSLPTYREHLQDIYTLRHSQDSRKLITDLLTLDPDFSAALHAYLTVANTEPFLHVYDQNDLPDRAGQQLLQQMLVAFTTRTDYSKGFRMTRSLATVAEGLRYMILARGGASAELVFDKSLVPTEVRLVDLGQIQWIEKTPGDYKPLQVTDQNEEIDLDIPTFFVRRYRQNPNTIYSYSPFVSAINTVAARSQIMNDLYRIMNLTGYPRIEATVLEEVLRKNTPESMKGDEDRTREWIQSRLNEVAQQAANMRPDTVWAHTDSVETKILNERGPGTSLDVSKIIEILNSMNQSALKTMATVIGRGGAQGVNTSTVEARIFSMSADEINGPVADLLADMFTLALRLHGSQSHVWCGFAPAELRPKTELETHIAIRQARLLELLSEGLITDDEFHLEMFNRFRPDDVPELAGTKFYGGGAQVDIGDISPNSDPLGRSISPEGATNPQRDNKNKSATRKAR